MKNKYFKLFKEWVIPVVVAVLVAMLIKEYLIFKVYVPTGSMIPTINEKDQLLVTKIYNLNNIKRGDIIVFESKELNETMIKRLIGMPGDKISIKEGQVTVNGEVLDEEYVKNNKFEYSGNFSVPDGKYFFLGDNRRTSNDARLWKNPYISGDCIIGKAQIRVYPFSEFGKLN